MAENKSARSVRNGARGHVRRPHPRESSSSGSFLDTEPQLTGGSPAEQLDGLLQSNRLDTSVSPRDERPEPLREEGDLDLCSGRGRSTRGITRDYLSLSGSTRRTRKKNEVQPPYKLSTQTPGPTDGPSSGVVAGKRSRSLAENICGKPDEESFSESSTGDDVIDVCGGEEDRSDQESVFTQPVRQHKSFKEGSAGGSGDAVMGATGRRQKGRKSVINGLRYGDDVEKELLMKICIKEERFFNSGKFAQDKNRGDVHKVIVDNFLTPVKNVVLKHREYSRTHSREDIEEKFGPGGVKGFKGWMASQKSQENARRDRKKNKSGLDGSGKLTRFEVLRSQMFSRSDEVNRPHERESLSVDTSQVHRGSGSSPRRRRSPSAPGGRRGESSHAGARKGPGSEKRARNDSGGSGSNDFVGSSAIEGCDSLDMDDSEEGVEDPTRWTSSGGKGKARVAEDPPSGHDSSGNLEGGFVTGGGSARDGSDGRDDEFSVSGTGDVVDVSTFETVPGEDDDSVVEREEFATDTLSCSPPAPDSALEKRQSRGRRNHVTGVLDEMRTGRIATLRYNDARLKLAEDTRRGDFEIGKSIAESFRLMASGNSGGGARTNRAGTVTSGAGSITSGDGPPASGAEAVKRFRCLLELHKDPLLPYAVSSSDFREALTVATRQILTREDGEALISIKSEINNDPDIDLEFSGPEILPAILASRS